MLPVLSSARYRALLARVVEIDGQRLEGSLAVEQEGPRLATVFTAPAPGLVAEGEGEVPSTPATAPAS